MKVERSWTRRPGKTSRHGPRIRPSTRSGIKWACAYASASRARRPGPSGEAPSGGGPVKLLARAPRTGSFYKGPENASRRGPRNAEAQSGPGGGDDFKAVPGEAAGVGDWGAVAGFRSSRGVEWCAVPPSGTTGPTPSREVLGPETATRVLEPRSSPGRVPFESVVHELVRPLLPAPMGPHRQPSSVPLGRRPSGSWTSRYGLE